MTKKKKIVNLTLRELKRLEKKECSKHINCSQCPYNWCCIINNKLNQEIEVEE